MIENKGALKDLIDQLLTPKEITHVSGGYPQGHKTPEVWHAMCAGCSYTQGDFDPPYDQKS
jgi:hypothetical protein